MLLMRLLVTDETAYRRVFLGVFILLLYFINTRIVKPILPTKSGQMTPKSSDRDVVDHLVHGAEARSEM